LWPDKNFQSLAIFIYQPFKGLLKRYAWPWSNHGFLHLGSAPGLIVILSAIENKRPASFVHDFSQQDVNGIGYGQAILG
jgi:hypothetical protein